MEKEILEEKKEVKLSRKQELLANLDELFKNANRDLDNLYEKTKNLVEYLAIGSQEAPNFKEKYITPLEEALEVYKTEYLEPKY